MIRFFKDGKEVLKVPPPLKNPIEAEMQKEPSMYGSSEKKIGNLSGMISRE